LNRLHIEPIRFLERYWTAKWATCLGNFVNPNQYNASMRLKAFFARHKRTVSLVSFLILFLTFAVREGLRDYLKDKLSAIATARSNAMTLSRLAEVNDGAGRVQLTLANMSKLLKLDAPGNPHNSTGLRIVALAETSRTAIYIRQSLKELAESVQFDPTLTASLERLTEDANPLTEQAQMLSLHNIEGASIDLGEIRQLEQQTFLNSVGTFQIQQQMLDKAGKERERIEHQLLMVTIAAYVLYGMGALLHILTLIYGTETTEESE
jgi:hypothetical protein